MSFEIEQDDLNYILEESRRDEEPDTTVRDEWIKDNKERLTEEYMDMWQDLFAEYCKEQYNEEN